MWDGGPWIIRDPELLIGRSRDGPALRRIVFPTRRDHPFAKAPERKHVVQYVTWNHIADITSRNPK